MHLFEWLFKYPLDTYREGELSLALSPRVELILLGLAGIAAASWWMYRREGRLRGPWRRLGLVALRTLGLALIGLCLLGPLLSIRKREDTRAVIAVGIDASRSMGMSAGEGKRSRFEVARDALAGPGGLLEKLAPAGELRLFAFGSAAAKSSAGVKKLVSCCP